MLKKEPAVILAALAALAQCVAIVVTGNPEADISAWAMPLLTILAGLLTRGRVTSENTVRQAGYTPDELVKRAENPSVRPAEEEG